MREQLEQRVTNVRKRLSSALGLEFTEWGASEAQQETEELSLKDKLRYLEITKSLRIAMHRHATLRCAPAATKAKKQPQHCLQR